MWKHSVTILLGILIAAWAAVGIAAAESTEATPEQTLRLALAGPLPAFNRHSFAYHERRALGLLYEPLVRYQEGSKPVPCLAQSWWFDHGGQAVTFKLRAGVRFHDGRPLSAADVAANIERARTPATGGHWALAAPEISTVTVLDETSVRVEFRYAPYLPLDAFTRLYIASPADFDKEGAAAGTGPFRLEEQSGETIVLARYEDYWRPGLPRLAGIRITSYPNGAEALRAVEEGSADLADRAPYQAPAEGGGYRMLRGPLESFYVLYLNPARRPFTNVDARRAVQYAVDRARLAREALAGAGPATSSPFPPGGPGHDPRLANYYAHAPERARHLFQAAGAGYASRLVLTTTDAYADLQALTPLVAEGLAALGMQPEVRSLSADEWHAGLVKGDYQMLLSYAGFAHTNPQHLLLNSAYRIKNNPLWPQGPPAEYTTWARMLGDLSAAAGAEDVLNRLQREMLAEAWAVPLAWRPVMLAVSKGLQGVKLSPDSNLLLGEASFAAEPSAPGTNQPRGK